MEEHYWWFVAMRHITDAIISTDLQNRAFTVLDAGCGTGYNVQVTQKGGTLFSPWILQKRPSDGVQRRGFRRVFARPL